MPHPKCPDQASKAGLRISTPPWYLKADTSIKSQKQDYPLLHHRGTEAQMLSLGMKARIVCFYVAEVLQFKRRYFDEAQKGRIAGFYITEVLKPRYLDYVRKTGFPVFMPPRYVSPGA